jgi:hypothetical protein
MKLPHPINSTNKMTKPANHLFHSALVSSLLTLMACTMLAPKIHHETANYIDPRSPATDQTAKDFDPGYNWFY